MLEFSRSGGRDLGPSGDLEMSEDEAHSIQLKKAQTVISSYYKDCQLQIDKELDVNHKI